MNTATFTTYFYALPVCLWSASTQGASDKLPGLPVDRFSPLLITILAVALLLIVAIYHIRTRRKRPASATSFSFGEKMADIAYAPELEHVGPLRKEDKVNAFTDSIQTLSLLCDEALTAQSGQSLALIGTRTGSGTTTIAIALARSLANSGKRTLLLDLNFERPMVQLATGATSATGISNYLLAGLIDGIVVRDADTPLDIVGTGNLPLSSVKDFLAKSRYKDSLHALTSLYERVVIDCAPVTPDQPDTSRIIAACDLRLLVIDQPRDSIQSPNVQGLLDTHRRWNRGTTLLLRNKVEPESNVTAPDVEAEDSPQTSLRPVHAEKWILQQADTLYTLKLTELRYRPMLTNRQISNYAGHQVACFRLTILGDVNYLLILGQFDSREAAAQTAQSLGLTQSSVRPITFADAKKGIMLEFRRRQKTKLAKGIETV